MSPAGTAGMYVSVGALWYRKGGWAREGEGAESEKCASAKPWGVNILVFSAPLWW